jgi:hypothetical protein
MRHLAWRSVPLLLAACASPSYVDQGAGQDDTLKLNPVVFTVHPAFHERRPDCLAIRRLEGDDHDKVRVALFAHLAPRVREVPLDQAGEDTACARLEGRITESGQTFLGVYSSVRIGAAIKMTRADGTPLWEASHTAAIRDGGLPLDPLGAVTGLYNAVANLANDEQPDRAADDLARRLVSTIPEMALAARAEAQTAPAVPAPPARDARLGVIADAWCQIAAERYRNGDKDGSVEALQQAGRTYLAAGDGPGAGRALAVLKTLANGEAK